MNSIEAMAKRSQASHLVLIYALAAATVSALTAFDPEPLSGTALVIFADTPLVTAITFSMIVHLVIVYNQKDLLADGFILIASLSAGLVLGALGAKLLGRMVPILGSFNNAIITFSLHYATGHVLIDYLEKERKITDVTLQYVKENKEKYEEEGRRKGKEAIEASKKMDHGDRQMLKELIKQYRTISEALKRASEKKLTDESVQLSERLLELGEKIGAIYARYGYSIT